MRIKRLNLFIQFTKEVFTFLPAGFIISLFLERFTKRKYKLFILLAFLVHLVYFACILSGEPTGKFFIVAGVLALSLGIFSGFILYESYSYLMDKNEILPSE